MPIHKHGIHDLIDDLTRSLSGNLAEPVSRHVQYALALLHATLESLEEIERSTLRLARPGGPGSVLGER